MRWLLNILGVSSSDEISIKKFRNSMSYVCFVGFRSFLRLSANHCIIPSLRNILFRYSGISIGKGVRINMGTNFLDDFIPGLITLEDDVSVAPFVSFVASSHPNNSDLFNRYEIAETKKILVKSNAWLGVGSVVLPGVTIGSNSIVGANAVVNSDVNDFAVMAGVPAKKVGDVRDRE